MRTSNIFAKPIAIALGIVIVITLGETGMIEKANHGFTSTVTDQAEKVVNFDGFISEIKRSH